MIIRNFVAVCVYCNRFRYEIIHSDMVKSVVTAEELFI